MRVILALGVNYPDNLASLFPADCNKAGPRRRVNLDRASGLDDDASALYIRRAMKTFVSSLVLLGTLAVSGASLVRAAEPPSSPFKGKVLILKNEYTMEGDIERVGDRYRVRRALGETWVPAERVLCLTASLPDAYAYLRSRVNIDDPDERLRLARWCRLNGLRQQALAELKAAADLRPDHAETQRLLQRWQQAALATPPPKTLAPTPTLPTDLELPPVEVTSESLGLFATRVQPILMNTCARCHATGHGGKFQLTQAYEGSLSNRRTLERNLASVLAEINLQQPELSLLLTKALSDHAHTGQAPLRDRQSAPYRSLENWVKLTVANNPHLRDSLPPSSAAPAPNLSIPPQAEDKGRATLAERRSATAEPSQWGADARPTVPLPSSPVPPSPSANKAATPIQPATPADPYDPEPFNRKMLPEATPQKER
jgi:hypothetical protein